MTSTSQLLQEEWPQLQAPDVPPFCFAQEQQRQDILTCDLGPVMWYVVDGAGVAG